MKKENDLKARLWDLDWKTATPEDVKQMLADGADVNVENFFHRGHYPIRDAAAYTPYPEVIEILVKAGADIVNGEGGETPLHAAARYNPNPEIINTLVKLGADVNCCKPWFDKPPLYVAVYNPNPQIINTLVELGADVNFDCDDDDDNEIKLIMQIVSYCQNLDMIKSFLKKCTPVDNDVLLWYALKNKNIDVFKMFWRADIDVNMKNKRGETMLCYAVMYNENPEMITTLITLGADIHNSDNKCLIIKAAALNNNPEIIKLLVELGLKLDITDEYGNTALKRAAICTSNPEVIKLLVELGADVNERYEDGSTPLIRAVSSFQHSEIIETLIALGADIHVKDECYKTAWDYAERRINYSLETIKVLKIMEKHYKKETIYIPRRFM